MHYNIYFEGSAIAYLILLNIYIYTQFGTGSDNNRRFRKLSIMMLVSTILDVVTAVTIDRGEVIPYRFNILLNSVYLFSNVLLGQYFMWYCTGMSGSGLKKSSETVLSRIIVAIAAVVLTVNVFNGMIFTFSETGEYIHGPVYFIAFAVPVVFMAISSIMLCIGFRIFTKKQRASALLYISILFIGCFVQLTRPHVLFIHFATSMGLMMLLFSLETPDYQSLQDTLAKLNEVKNEAEEAMHIAQNANSAKSDFLAGISHEVRTPINAILGYNSLIMNETEKDSVTEYSVKVQAAGNTLLAMISSLIDYGDIERGNVIIENTPYYTISLLRDVAEYGRYNADRKGLECRLRFDGEMPRELRGDSTKIKQIFNNLISNAVKYTEKGYVEISARWTQTSDGSGLLSASVSDSGIGIKDEDISKITAAFEKGGSGRSHNVEGMGVGLSIVTSLVRKMGGSFRINSVYGSGTTFSFDIEQEIANSEPMGSFEERGKKPTTTDKALSFTAPNARILAVDDNEINLDVLCRSLKKTGASIDTASNGVEALALISKKRYNIIFLDHMMPVMDGIETVKTIKKQNLCPNVPIIVVTANAVSGEKNSYFNIGFDDYLSKPVSGPQLMAILKKYLPAGMIIEGGAEPAEKMPESTVPAGELTLENRFPMLDTAAGLEFCCEDEEFYISMIEEYVNSPKLDDLNKLLEEKDFPNYRIQIHALKSTSRTIGAEAMGSAAERLEKAQKEGDNDYILKNHAAAMEQYKNLIEDLKAGLAGKVISAPVQQETEENTEYELLVADDDKISLLVTGNIFKKGFHVRTASSVREAFSMLERNIPDAVLLDIHMPGMSGFELLRMMKADERLKWIPVIFVTADSDPKSQIACIESGAADFVRKPLIKDIMIKRTVRAIEHSRMIRQLTLDIESRTIAAEKEKAAYERLSVQAVNSLADAVDAKDKYTRRHSLRVAQYSREIARRYGMSEKEQDTVYYAGLLHDIGMIGVSDEIINKTDKLTEEEFDIVKLHAMEGFHILDNITEMPEIARGARWHHERYDGKGYPDGLAGKDIPVFARILCIADSYDSMTSNRSFRNICTKEFVRNEMVMGSGSQFDPELAAIMIEMIDEDVNYHMRGPVINKDGKIVEP